MDQRQGHLELNYLMYFFSQKRPCPTNTVCRVHMNTLCYWICPILNLMYIFMDWMHCGITVQALFRKQYKLFDGESICYY